jgi:uncharacterized protein YciI
MSSKLFLRPQLNGTAHPGSVCRLGLNRFTIRTYEESSRFSVCRSVIPLLALFAQASAATPGPAVPSTAIKTWFIRLIPPRPTFDKDMTSTEEGLMQQHFQYWRGLFEKGLCVFGGPVLDPRGVYGVLAIRAATETEARDLAAADPSVKGGVNRIEVAEMRIAFLPKSYPE